jgi:hypothetical protein
VIPLFVATPCYRSDPAAAIAWAKNLGAELGIEVEACCPRSPPWLHVARAMLVGAYKDGQGASILFRDDDLDPSPVVVSRMLAANVPAIVAPYVLRADDDESGKPSPARFDTTLNEDGSVRWAGLGCALIKRAVISRLWFDHGDELQFMRRGHRYVAMFRDFFADRDDGVELLEEDRAFWWRVQAAGYRVEALDDVMIPHAGDALRWLKAEHVP